MAERRERPLRLIAQDADDLQVISAALQDAVGRVGDLVFEPRARRFTAVFNRFRWEREGRPGVPERVRAGFQLDGVLAARVRGLAPEAKDAVVELLALEFTPAAEPPGGTARLVFAGGGEIALDLECVEGALADLSRPWATRRKPRHDGGGQGA